MKFIFLLVLMLIFVGCENKQNMSTYTQSTQYKDYNGVTRQYVGMLDLENHIKTWTIFNHKKHLSYVEKCSVKNMKNYMIFFKGTNYRLGDVGVCNIDPKTIVDVDVDYTLVPCDMTPMNVDVLCEAPRNKNLNIVKF